MNDGKTVLIAIGVCSLVATVIGVIWAIYRDLRRRPEVVVTRDRTPLAEAELIADDGAQFSVSPQTGFAHPPYTYIGRLFIVRHVQSRRELARFNLQAGLNEVNII